MTVTKEDREIQLLQEKFLLNEENRYRIAMLLRFYFSDDESFSDAVAEVVTSLSLTEIQAKELILDGSLLYFESLESEKKQEIQELFKENNISFLNKQRELEEFKAGILTPRDLSYANINEEEEALDIFKNFLKDALISDNDENKAEFNYRTIMALFGLGQNFKIDLEKAMMANQQIIGSKIVLDGRSQPATIANWIQDFIKEGIIEKGIDFDRALYFSHSANFQALDENNKKLIAKLLDLYWRIKFFPQSFGQIPEDDWYLIPLSNEDKLPIKNALASAVVVSQIPKTDLIAFYHQTLDQFATVALEKEKIKKTSNNQLGELVNQLIINIKQKQTTAVMAILEILAEEKNLAVIKNDMRLANDFRQAQAIKMDQYDLGNLFGGQFNLKYLTAYLKWLLNDILGLKENEAAVFALKLANIMRRNGDGSFMKVAYGDAMDMTFRWTGDM